MRLLSTAFLSFALLLSEGHAFSMQMRAETPVTSGMVATSSRRAFLTTAAAAVAGVSVSKPAVAAPEIFNTPSGMKYAVLKPPKQKPVSAKGDIVAVEYTGYLTNGAIFDGTHSEGKGNALMFELGGNAVIDGMNEIIGDMGVGEKRQVIIPPNLAFGSKGICVEKDGVNECLVKPDSTLVYDITLKRTAIPPP